MARGGMGSHEKPIKGATDVWLTPPDIITDLGPFDLDPCAATNRPWPTADTMYTIEDNGLRREWCGFVWLNPPYSDVWTWVAKLADHGHGIALIFARTETRGFHKHVWSRASAISFPQGRLTFRHEDGSAGRGNAGAPSCFVAYGNEAVERLRNRRPHDAFVDLRKDAFVP